MTTTQVDGSDPAEVYRWAFIACRNKDLEFLAESSGVSPSRDAVASAIAATVPPETRDAALRGCNDGFVEQDRRGGPSPRPPASWLDRNRLDAAQ